VNLFRESSEKDSDINNLNNKYKLVDGIIKFPIKNFETNNITNFYKKNPFPNYKKGENISDLLKLIENNQFIIQLKKKVENKKLIAEFGSGTCQLSISLASGTNSIFFAIDATLDSLEIGKKFASENFVENIIFINSDIFNHRFNNNIFDVVISNGVLHHTKNPYLAFEEIIKTLKNDGYIVLGLYNYYGRIKNSIYKFFYKYFGYNFIKNIDPILKKKDDEQVIAWLEDQFNHPIESRHTFDEVLDWFKKNNIEFINSIPSCGIFNRNSDFFSKSKSYNFFSRLIAQLKMIFSSYGNDGGLFIMIGKKIS
jgi:SAM-dependent methyltransferase